MLQTRLRQELRQTVRSGGLTLAFQRRRRLHDHAALGADAQVRWPCRARGMLNASALMPMVDECGLGADVLAWILAKACAAAMEWPDGVVAVSVPAKAVRDGTLLPLVGEALAASGLDPERLEIALDDAEADGGCTDTLLALFALRDAGVAVSLAAYGRGQACLIKLKYLPLSAIKLDRSLVRDAVGDPAAAALARTLIDYAHALDITVLAALETPAHCALLHELGCDACIERAGPAEAA